ncbi:hypothetical protein ACFQ78_32120 [Streptomyces sp. NPDC056519]|uniref:hypothetical protein n=1 Tax=Streptomyces sp. NPDC056519 TaxID=3345849 RepID=UPI0036947391
MKYFVLGVGSTEHIPQPEFPSRVPFPGDQFEVYSDNGEGMNYDGTGAGVLENFTFRNQAIVEDRMMPNLVLGTHTALHDYGLRRHWQWQDCLQLWPGVNVSSPLYLCQGTADTCPTTAEAADAGQPHTCKGLLGLITPGASVTWMACSHLTVRESVVQGEGGEHVPEWHSLDGSHYEEDLAAFLSLTHAEQLERSARMHASTNERDLLLASTPFLVPQIDARKILKKAERIGSEVAILQMVTALPEAARQRLQEAAEQGDQSCRQVCGEYEKQAQLVADFHRKSQDPEEYHNCLDMWMEFSEETQSYLKSSEIPECKEAIENIRYISWLDGRYVARIVSGDLDQYPTVDYLGKFYTILNSFEEPQWPQCRQEIWCWVDSKPINGYADRKPTRLGTAAAPENKDWQPKAPDNFEPDPSHVAKITRREAMGRHGVRLKYILTKAGIFIDDTVTDYGVKYQSYINEAKKRRTLVRGEFTYHQGGRVRPPRVSISGITEGTPDAQQVMKFFKNGKDDKFCEQIKFIR